MSIFQDETPGFTDPAEIDDGRTLETIEESELEQDRRTTGTFAEGQQRLARALDAITRACLMDGSDCGSNFCPPARTE